MLRELWAIVREWVVNPKCPWCGERSRDLETHYHIEHAGDR